MYRVLFLISVQDLEASLCSFGRENDQESIERSKSKIRMYNVHTVRSLEPHIRNYSLSTNAIAAEFSFGSQ